MTKPTRDEIAAAHPEAVSIAREFRKVFGDGVRLTHALHKITGAELGKPMPTESSVPYPEQPAKVRMTQK
jgi:hypothetical protein